jgi:protein gp37
VTKIEWTDKVWNVVTGCSKVSPGCSNCYAETFSERFRGTAGHHFENGFDLTLRPERLALPLKWRKPHRVFVNSMSDPFHKDIPDEYIARAFAIMALTPQHTYQILTKRHGRMRSLLTDLCTCGKGCVPGTHFRSWMAWAVSKANPNRIPGVPDDAERRVYHGSSWPLPNVWLGASIEDQKRADLRIPALLETPAAVRFLSCEPLLGPVDLGRWLRPVPDCGHVATGDGTCSHPEAFSPECHRWADCPVRRRYTDWHGLDWVIVGGESGHKARAMHPNWARGIRDACEVGGVPFFFKQWGEWGPAPFIVRVCDPDVGWTGTDEELVAAKADSEARGATHVHTGNCYEQDGEWRYEVFRMGHKPWSLERVGLPDGMEPIRRWGKGHAGRELDGRTWDQFPQAVKA